jgi:hypothetical protein
LAVITTSTGTTVSKLEIMIIGTRMTDVLTAGASSRGKRGRSRKSLPNLELTQGKEHKL